MLIPTPCYFCKVSVKLSSLALLFRRSFGLLTTSKLFDISRFTYLQNTSNMPRYLSLKPKQFSSIVSYRFSTFFLSNFYLGCITFLESANFITYSYSEALGYKSSNYFAQLQNRSFKFFRGNLHNSVYLLYSFISLSFMRFRRFYLSNWRQYYFRTFLLFNLEALPFYFSQNSTDLFARYPLYIVSVNQKNHFTIGNFYLILSFLNKLKRFQRLKHLYRRRRRLPKKIAFSLNVRSCLLTLANLKLKRCRNLFKKSRAASRIYSKKYRCLRLSKRHSLSPMFKRFRYVVNIIKKDFRRKRFSRSYRRRAAFLRRKHHKRNLALRKKKLVFGKKKNVFIRQKLKSDKSLPYFRNFSILAHFYPHFRKKYRLRDRYHRYRRRYSRIIVKVRSRFSPFKYLHHNSLRTSPYFAFLRVLISQGPRFLPKAHFYMFFLAVKFRWFLFKNPTKYSMRVGSRYLLLCKYQRSLSILRHFYYNYGRLPLKVWLNYSVTSSARVWRFFFIRLRYRKMVNNASASYLKNHLKIRRVLWRKLFLLQSLSLRLNLLLRSFSLRNYSLQLSSKLYYRVARLFFLTRLWFYFISLRKKKSKNILLFRSNVLFLRLFWRFHSSLRLGFLRNYITSLSTKSLEFSRLAEKIASPLRLFRLNSFLLLDNCFPFSYLKHKCSRFIAQYFTFSLNSNYTFSLTRFLRPLLKNFLRFKVLMRFNRSYLRNSFSSKAFCLVRSRFSSSYKYKSRRRFFSVGFITFLTRRRLQKIFLSRFRFFVVKNILPLYYRLPFPLLISPSRLPVKVATCSASYLYLASSVLFLRFYNFIKYPNDLFEGFVYFLALTFSIFRYSVVGKKPKSFARAVSFISNLYVSFSLKYYNFLKIFAPIPSYLLRYLRLRSGQFACVFAQIHVNSFSKSLHFFKNLSVLTGLPKKLSRVYTKFYLKRRKIIRLVRRTQRRPFYLAKSSLFYNIRNLQKLTNKRFLKSSPLTYKSFASLIKFTRNFTLRTFRLYFRFFLVKLMALYLANRLRISNFRLKFKYSIYKSIVKSTVLVKPNASLILDLESDFERLSGPVVPLVVPLFYFGKYDLLLPLKDVRSSFLNNIRSIGFLINFLVNRKLNLLSKKYKLLSQRALNIFDFFFSFVFLQSFIFISFLFNIFIVNLDFYLFLLYSFFNFNSGLLAFLVVHNSICSFGMSITPTSTFFRRNFASNIKISNSQSLLSMSDHIASIFSLRIFQSKFCYPQKIFPSRRLLHKFERGLGLRNKYLSFFSSKFKLRKLPIRQTLDETRRMGTPICCYWVLIAVVNSSNLLFDRDLRRRVQITHSRLKKIKAYRGVRLLFHLPSHGQRTHTNAQTPKRLLARKILAQSSFRKKRDRPLTLADFLI